MIFQAWFFCNVYFIFLSYCFNWIVNPLFGFTIFLRSLTFTNAYITYIFYFFISTFVFSHQICNYEACTSTNTHATVDQYITFFDILFYQLVRTIEMLVDVSKGFILNIYLLMNNFWGILVIQLDSYCDDESYLILF